MAEKLKPMDLIAILTIIGCFVLLFFHRDGYISATLTLIIGYYFGKRASSMPNNLNQNNDNETT